MLSDKKKLDFHVAKGVKLPYFGHVYLALKALRSNYYI